MAKNDFSIIKAWDFNCEPKIFEGVNFVEVSPIPLNLAESDISMTAANQIVQKHGKDDCCCNGGGLWHDGDSHCWFTGSRKVAKELIKCGATIGNAKVRHLVKV